MNPESHILQSWQQNAEVWTDTVRQEKIESRALVTNRAMVQAVMKCQPRSVLDVGCGEGWLARTLSAQNVRVLGVDAIPALIKQAQRAGGARIKSVATTLLFAAVFELKLLLMLSSVIFHYSAKHR